MKHLKGNSEEIKNAFAKSLKEIRRHVGFSLVDLEKLTGINNPSLSRYENGKVEPSLSQAVMIAESFNLTVEDFINCGLEEKDFSMKKTINETFDEKIIELVDELGENAKKMLKEIYKNLNIEEILKGN